MSYIYNLYTVFSFLIMMAVLNATFSKLHALNTGFRMLFDCVLLFAFPIPFDACIFDDMHRMQTPNNVTIWTLRAYSATCLIRMNFNEESGLNRFRTLAWYAFPSNLHTFLGDRNEIVLSWRNGECRASNHFSCFPVWDLLGQHRKSLTKNRNSN